MIRSLVSAIAALTVAATATHAQRQRLSMDPFGYISFAYGITRHLRPGVNVLAVRVDNSRQPNSRWYTGSGIYRHIWLTLTDPLHVAHWGTYALPLVNPTTNDLHLTWDVPYEPGVLRAVGRTRDGREVSNAETRTAGPPAAIRLLADRDTITDSPGDVAHVMFEVVDSAGTVVPTADPLVRFSVTGGTIVAVDNANLQDLEPYQRDQRRAFSGRGLASARSGRAGRLTVTAAADGLSGTSISMVVQGGQPVNAVPPAR